MRFYTDKKILKVIKASFVWTTQYEGELPVFVFNQGSAAKIHRLTAKKQFDTENCLKSQQTLYVTTNVLNVTHRRQTDRRTTDLTHDNS